MNPMDGPAQWTTLRLQATLWTRLFAGRQWPGMAALIVDRSVVQTVLVKGSWESDILGLVSGVPMR
jgi:hypothetical protein